jgi:starch phosphorylase
VPPRWVELVRHTLTTLRPQVQAARMVREYVEDWYAPAARAAARISGDDFGPARELAAYRTRLNTSWPQVEITGVDASGLPDTPEVGAAMTVRASVRLAGLDPKDVCVEAVIGRVGGETDDLADTVTVGMEHVGAADGMGERFESVVKLPHAGLTGYTVRVLPSHPLLASSAELAKIVLPS